MSGKMEFDKSLKLMRWCMFLSGIKLYESRWHPILEIFSNTLYYINIFVLYSVIFAEIYWFVDGIQIGRDFVEMSLTAPCITISILSTLKTVPLYFKRGTICQIIEVLKAIHPRKLDDTDSFEKNQYLNTGRTEKKQHNNMAENDATIEGFTRESVKLLKIVGFILLSVSIAVLITFLLAPLIWIYWEFYTTSEMKIKYPFTVKYWFDAYKVSFWPLVYFLQTWATVIVCVNIYGTETLFYSFCTYIEMHFRILSHQVENLQGPGTKEALITAVKKHQLLISLVEQTENLYSRPVLFHFVSSSFLICLSAFNITVAQEIGSVFAFVTFLGLSFSQVSLLCYFGDKLMRSSTEVSGAIYKCPWYNFTINEKKVLFIMMMRAQKPCKLTASKFSDLNLRAFTTILSRSWSYFALLKTVYK